jgi:serine/threonine-protein kinase RsbW
MAPKPKRLDVMLESVLESVDVAESMIMRISDSVGFSDEECHKIGMAIREGVINAYNYGNRKDRNKKIRMIVELAADTMVIHIVDQGKGFELEEVADPLAEENLLRTSGRGIFLMRAFMDDFTVQSGPEGGADLVLTKKLPIPGSNNGDGGSRGKES